MLLAIDTSTTWMGLALFDGVQVVSESIWQTRSHHTVELAPAIQQMMARSGVRPADLEALGVALGPGSFTSLRIGLAVAKGMALALHLPVIGVPTLDILAAQAPPSELPLAAVLKAGRGRLGVQFFSTILGSGWQAQGDPRVLTAEELSDMIKRPTLVWGELDSHERQVLARKRKNVVLASPAQALRRPSYLAEIAWRRWQLGKTDEVVTLAPIYLHLAEPIPG
jgi:tRNA threonylcarbamoyladenosine biosynthesis protein TsaB